MSDQAGVLNNDIGFQVILLTKCNFRCRHCYFLKGGHLDKENYWDEELTPHLNKLLKATDAIKVIWTGGESTLNPSFHNIIVEATAGTNVKSNWVLSNGWWLQSKTEEILDKLKQIPNLTLLVSRSEFHSEFQSDMIQKKIIDPNLSKELGIPVHSFLVSESTYPIANYSAKVISVDMDFRSAGKYFPDDEQLKDWSCVKDPELLNKAETLNEAAFNFPFIYPNGNMNFCWAPEQIPFGNIKDDPEELRQKFLKFNEFIHNIKGEINCKTCVQKVNAAMKRG